MTKKSNRSLPILGYSDRQTVKLDVDGREFRDVRRLAFRVMKHFRLRGDVILRSSRDHYHIVFNKTVTWEQNVNIMAWASLISKNAGLKRWFLMQCIKGASTLRGSSKGDKSPPRIVFREGNQDREIASFERWRKRIKKADKQRGKPP